MEATKGAGLAMAGWQLGADEQVERRRGSLAAFGVVGSHFPNSRLSPGLSVPQRVWPAPPPAGRW